MSRIPGSQFRCAGMKISYLGSPKKFMADNRMSSRANGKSGAGLVPAEHYLPRKNAGTKSSPPPFLNAPWPYKTSRVRGASRMSGAISVLVT